MKSIPLHYDIAWIEHGLGHTRLVAKVWEETIARIGPNKEGSYAYTSGWHTEEECPFKDDLLIRARSVPDARLPAEE